MNNKIMNRTILKKLIIIALMMLLIQSVSHAQLNTPLRRPISPEQPMWLIHIDTWNYPDPQKIIDLIPKDIRPYVVMNISLSISHDKATSRFSIAEYGYETAKSWLRTCAENRMWAMIQPSSGAYSQFPDNDMTIYEELYRDYPNLIGFNYCEQSWGYGDNDPLATAWTDRIAHFAKLLKLGDKYGGYLVVSWCANQWQVSHNPVAMVKRNPEFASACKTYTKNYILSEKYTFKSYQHDMESICLGSYLSGFSGQYGLRYDDSGWSDKDGHINENFTMATYGVPFLEHVMLTGQTVIDGPELIWKYCFTEMDAAATSDGYASRRWKTFPQFNNVSVDLFRKVLDGTVRIPDREEVIDRTRVVFINNASSGTDDYQYSSPETLFEGLYRMDGDGNYENNTSFFKKTGRYPTIPTVYQLSDSIANTFDVKVKRTDYASRWPDIASKVSEFNSLFPEEYRGDLYAGRNENGWVTYNPYKTGQTASASIPFKYNTCDSMFLSYSQYTSGVIKEFSDHLTVYLSNFDIMLNPNLKTDVIKIYGSSAKPSYTFEERGNHQQSKVTEGWSDGVFTLTIEHNGPVDIQVNCSGTATDRLTEYQTANIVVPASPPAYAGPLQYEAETFEYKSISGIIKNGYHGNIRNYTGQGYLNFGTGSSAGIRDRVTVLNEGTYKLKTRYTVTGNVNTIDLYVNGIKTDTPEFIKTDSLSAWGVKSQMVDLKSGVNTIEYKANATGANTIYFDNIVIEANSTEDSWLEAECGTLGSLWETLDDPGASNGKFVSIKKGNNSTDSAPLDVNAKISYDFNAAASGTYTIWGRVIMPTTDDNSFWIKMDSGSWQFYADTALSQSWTWVKIDTFTLSAGKHTLAFAYNEDGAELDKLFITVSDSIPSGPGGPATNCTTRNQTPIAYSGPDKTLVDNDGDGTVTLALTSTGSFDPDGTIVSYEWTTDDSLIATGANPSVDLPVGVNNITLTVTDDKGATDADAITITVYDSSYEQNKIWLEPECGVIGNNWDTIADPAVSNGYYATAKPGMNNINQAPANDDQLIKIPFTIASTGNYYIYARLNCPGYDADSFWIKMDDGTFRYYNGLKSNGWQWFKLNVFALTEGEHTLSIGYREDGALLDKVFITKYTDLPAGIGDDACNCINDTVNSDTTSTGIANFSVKYDRNALLQNYPNPFSTSTVIKYYLKNPGHVFLKIYDLNGQEAESLVNIYQEAGDHEITWHSKGLSSGVYIYRLQVGGFLETKRLILKK